MAEKYFSIGPEPTTERGKRRHANRTEKQKIHAQGVHVERKVWLANQSFKPCGLGRPTL